MNYRIERAETNREPLGEYRYRIYEDSKLIAHYWHDYRGDDHGIEFVNGTSEHSPFGRMTEFIEGGGPKPLVLSAKAVAYLKQMKS
jgi:hypothetical protein